MNEDGISTEMYQAALSDPLIQVLSWQGVSGKSYMTRDVRLRIHGEVMIPDLILLYATQLWIIEIKGRHSESMREDEPKLQRLRASTVETLLRKQIARKARTNIEPDVTTNFAVAYSTGPPSGECDLSIVHIAWEEQSRDIASALRLP